VRDEPAAVIALEPLTRAGFEPFGDAIGLSLAEGDGRAANQGTARRHDDAARVVNARPGTATPNLALFRSVGRALPVTVPLL
jgi:ureidoglycolate hydrolase